jgi:formamidopyrimidine-DNA glycosylase
VLDPNLDALGPDATEVTVADLRPLLVGDAPLKARLMDQRRLAGMGNLLCDECLWRAGLDPARPAGSLTVAESRRLHRHLHRTLEVLGERGGSHTGDLQAQRHRGGRCPRCDTPLLRRTVGGRTTYSCPTHQPVGGGSDAAHYAARAEQAGAISSGVSCNTRTKDTR